MIEVIPDLPENVLGFRARGEVTKADYTTVVGPAVDAQIRAQGKIRIIIHLGPDFGGLKTVAVLQDAKLGLEHLRSWEKIAVVTDDQPTRDAITAFGWLVPAEIELFNEAGMPQAIMWAST